MHSGRWGIFVFGSSWYTEQVSTPSSRYRIQLVVDFLHTQLPLLFANLPAHLPWGYKMQGTLSYPVTVITCGASKALEAFQLKRVPESLDRKTGEDEATVVFCRKLSRIRNNTRSLHAHTTVTTIHQVISARVHSHLTMDMADKINLIYLAFKDPSLKITLC
jgi:hypothetical protein